MSPLEARADPGVVGEAEKRGRGAGSSHLGMSLHLLRVCLAGNRIRIDIPKFLDKLLPVLLHVRVPVSFRLC